MRAHEVGNDLTVHDLGQIAQAAVALPGAEQSPAENHPDGSPPDVLEV
jgi:hypothetical protein